MNDSSDLHRHLEVQRAAAMSEPLPSAARRREVLDRLYAIVKNHEQEWIDAISADFGHRAAFETRLLEWMPLLEEIRHLQKRLAGWMRPRRAAVNWNFLPSRARLHPQPLGVVGVIGAWNYPLMLTLSPAANAIAAGNRVMIKPSEKAPKTAELLERLVAKNLDPAWVSVVNGDETISKAFSSLPFDHIVFTGSGQVGRKVMAAAANHLTPVTLELGGKSPAIVHAGFPLDDAADRIATAKFWNAGQTCIAPDYAMVPTTSLQPFVDALLAAVARRWPESSRNSDYTHMIDAHAHQRMQTLIDDAVARGARAIQAWPSSEGRSYSPTLLLGATSEMQVMQEEIFGPVLPIIGYDDVQDALNFVQARDRPLALYYFDHDATRVQHVLDTTHAGGVTINDCMFHFAQHGLPFGGVGGSGMGAYHGETGFRTLSHYKPVLMQSQWSARVLGRFAKPPYGESARRLLRWMVRD